MDEMKTRHIISFDVEEYFDVELAKRAGVGEDTQKFPSRVRVGLEAVLEVLRERRVSATFFVLGKLARNEKKLIREISDGGYEIAFHSIGHRMITQMSRSEFREDLRAGKGLLEDITGRAVAGYRSPTFSIVRRTVWALDELVEAGIEYDSSIFPVRHNLYGISVAERRIHWAIGPGGGRILELPPLTYRIFGMNLAAGGGGYFRLLPVGFISGAIRKCLSQGGRAVMYFHPWEFDANQPVLPMGLMSRWRHRVGLSRTREKLRRLLSEFEFTSVADVLSELKETQVEFDYGRLMRNE